jgi:hypothetical protein
MHSAICRNVAVIPVITDERGTHGPPLEEVEDERQDARNPLSPESFVRELTSGLWFSGFQHAGNCVEAATCRGNTC